MSKDKILIDRKDIVELLNSFRGPMYLVNELWAIQNLPGSLLERLRQQVMEQFHGPCD